MDEPKVKIFIKVIDPITNKRKIFLVDGDYKMPHVLHMHKLHEAICNRVKKFYEDVLARLEKV